VVTSLRASLCLVSRAAPPASNYIAQKTMEANRRTDTTPERRLRSALHSRGLRYRKDLRINAAGRWVRPDIVFTKSRLAVFVDGCFWHRCPTHAAEPRSNSDYWRVKFDRNVARDRADEAALAEAGWAIIRIWEHEDPELAADRVEAELQEISYGTSASAPATASATR
jgi:DNA mismatch endonuclease (patch repair protein)